jgi:hypothetical protein
VLKWNLKFDFSAFQCLSVPSYDIVSSLFIFHARTGTLLLLLDVTLLLKIFFLKVVNKYLVSLNGDLQLAVGLELAGHCQVPELLDGVGSV